MILTMAIRLAMSECPKPPFIALLGCEVRVGDHVIDMDRTHRESLDLSRWRRLAFPKKVKRRG